jgi:hypothetical protein
MALGVWIPALVINNPHQEKEAVRACVLMSMAFVYLGFFWQMTGGPK